MRALNRTAASAKTMAVRSIAADLGIAQKRIKENVTVDKAYPEKLTATLSARKGGPGVVEGRGKSQRRGRIPLLEFHARGPVPSRGKGGGVRYNLPGGRGVAPHAFIATMRSGHVGVFQRIPGTQMTARATGMASSLRLHRMWKREKIVELYGPSIPRVFSRKAILAALKKSGEENLAKNMAHEVTNLLRPGAR
jgi:hypothetical protein